MERRTTASNSFIFSELCIYAAQSSECRTGETIDSSGWATLRRPPARTFGLWCDFHRGVAPAALACGGDGGDAEPVACAAGKVFDGCVRARGDCGVSPGGLGRRVWA